MSTHRDPARITVLGAGFGALSTVRELRRRDRTQSNHTFLDELRTF
jgi:NADH dehydrogenase FAD-containing subunit